MVLKKTKWEGKKIIMVKLAQHLIEALHPLVANGRVLPMVAIKSTKLDINTNVKPKHNSSFQH